MRHGVDANFLVAVEAIGHVHHAPARALLEQVVRAGDLLVVAPQVLAEFTHTVTDPRRIVTPLSMAGALERAGRWWDSDEIVHAFPCERSIALQLEWMEKYRLGRKRILDTLLASTLTVSGVTSLITNNQADFRVFGCFDLIGFGGEEGSGRVILDGSPTQPALHSTSEHASNRC